MNLGGCIKATSKLMVVALLTAAVVVGAFSVGYVMQAVQLSSVSAAAAPAAPVAPDVAEAPEAPETPQPQITFPDEELSNGSDVFQEAWTYVEDRFYGDVPSEKDRVYGAIQGMVSSFGDPNTAYLEPNQAAIFREDVTGSFEGIGATVRMDELGRLLIAEPFAGQPAAEAGLLSGDIVVEVDNVPVQGMNLYEAISLIRGPENTTVVLTIFREGLSKPFDVPIVRARIEIEIVEAERLENDVGYVSLSEFNRGASDEVAEAIQSLEREGQLRALIFDLRNNPGGLLDEAIFVSSQFIDRGVITVEREKGDVENVFDARPGGVATDVPLVVLVNGGSASASEIVAGAVQENERGILIGEQTFGKGTVQIPHTLSDGSELRVTIAEWLTPTKRQINEEGITPDIVVERTQEDYEQGIDPQLDRALEYLSENL